MTAMGFLRATHRLFVWLGLVAEQATETDAINEAMVERCIRDARAKAAKAHDANGQLAGQIVLLNDQSKRQQRERAEVQSLLRAAAAANDAINGAHLADQLATLEQDVADTHAQLASLEDLYRQNTEIIANGLREIQKIQREFEAVKAKAAVGRSLEQLAVLMSGSLAELQGMMGSELSQSLQQLRQAAAGGEGKMRATLDLAKGMGSFERQQAMRAARGAILFKEYQKKIGSVQPSISTPARLEKKP
jgi:hypothetical protein